MKINVFDSGIRREDIKLFSFEITRWGFSRHGFSHHPFVRSVLTVSHAVMLLKPGLVEMTVGATCYKYSKGGQNILLQPETADRFMKVTRKSGFKNRGDGDEKNVHHIGLDKPARLTVIWICNR